MHKKEEGGYLRLLDSFVLCNLYAKDIFTKGYSYIQYRLSLLIPNRYNRNEQGVTIPIRFP